MRIRLYPKCTANCKYVDDWCRIRRLNEKTEAKLIYRDKCFSEIKELLQCGGIIALRKIENDVSPFQVIGFYGNSINDVYYMQLGRGRSRFSNIGRMYLSVHKDGVVFLNDWYVENPGNGYGRFFLKSVMDYLRRQGYKKLLGKSVRVILTMNPCCDIYIRNWDLKLLTAKITVPFDATYSKKQVKEKHGQILRSGYRCLKN